MTLFYQLSMFREDWIHRIQIKLPPNCTSRKVLSGEIEWSFPNKALSLGQLHWGAIINSSQIQSSPTLDGRQRRVSWRSPASLVSQACWAGTILLPHKPHKMNQSMRWLKIDDDPWFENKTCHKPQTEPHFSG